MVEGTRDREERRGEAGGIYPFCSNFSWVCSKKKKKKKITVCASKVNHKDIKSCEYVKFVVTIFSSLLTLVT